MPPNTHLHIDPELVGRPLALAAGHAEVELLVIGRMAADARGLAHGGFVFGLADYAAMLAVNDPFVVLGAAETRFLRPLRVGDAVRAVADVVEEKGKKRQVRVVARRGDEDVFEGTFTCFVLEKHVLD